MVMVMASALGTSSVLGCTEGPEVSTGVSAIGECETEWVCGSNSPEIDHYGFHELNLEGVKNQQHFAIESRNGEAQIYKDGEPYLLKVLDSRIYGFSAKGELSGQALVGAEIHVLREGQLEYNIRIESVREINYAVGTGTLDSYRLSWFDDKHPADAKRSVCKPPVILTEPSKLISGWFEAVRRGVGGQELLGMNFEETLVFEGDRFDAASMTMAQEADPRWFNLGCAGHTLAKMHLTRNTIASGAEAYGAKHHERQATLKMLVADYCGDGTPFTVAGEQLRWMGGEITYFTRPQTLEARWGSDGAKCLHEPRLRNTSSTLAPQLFGNDIDQAIASQCSIPRCEDLDVMALEGSPRISGNP